MPNDLLLGLNGTQVKNIDLPQYPDSAWDWIEGAPETKDEDLYSRVAAVFSVAHKTADTVANMPFALYDSADNEYDTSDDWQNKVKFMPRPRELLKLWRMSLFFSNAAYGFMEGNRAIKNLRYIKASSITPIVDKWEGLQGFKRRIGSESRTFSLDDRRIFWLWRLDHTTELLPSLHTEFKALMAAAGVLFYADYYVQNFFQRGGIKPTMLMVKGVPTREEREKIEGIWDKLVHGWHKYLGKIFNAEAVEPHVIGEGIDNIKDSALHAQKLEDIAIASGMPLSLLLANSANYATAEVEYRTWFRDKIIPDCRFIEEGMNEQLFTPLGLRFKFLPNITDTGTAEEQERAGAYAALVASNIKPSVAAQMLGYELPPDYDEYEMLDADYYEMLERKAITSGMGATAIETPEIQEPKPPKPNVVPPVDKAPTPKSAPTLLTIEQLRELELWQSFAFRKLKRGEGLDFPFVCKELPEQIATDIRELLPSCKTEREIERAFNMDAPRREDDSLKELAEALNKAVEATAIDA
jgi:hypothetical protein